MNLRRFIERTFTPIPSRCHGDEIVCLCEQPGCGDLTGNRSFNIKNGKTSCWRCGKGGNILGWLSRLGYDIDDLDQTGLQHANLSDLVEEEERVTVPFVETKLPGGFQFIRDHPDSYYGKAIGKMARRKNLTFEDFVRARVGFTRGKEKGMLKWEPYAIFPVLEWGKVVYYQGRTFIDRPGESTKRFPDKKECPYGSRYWLYNIDRARKKSVKGPVKLILVESILNVLSLEKKLKERKITGFVPLALFKHKISKEQAVKLKALRNIEEICLMFDPDASDDAWETAHTLSFSRVTAVDMPRGVDANDNSDIAVDLLANRRDARNHVMALEKSVGLF